MHLEKSVEIDASPERVWAVMADVERWPEWTRSMSRVELTSGRPLGSGSEARVKQPRMPAMRWRVTDYQPGVNFTWETRSPGAKTVASHRIAPRPGGGSTVTLVLDQTGPLAAVISPFIGRMSRRYVQMEAEGLKRRAETAG
jgi:uncharacterized protein YndB with AHSA1/START domain